MKEKRYQNWQLAIIKLSTYNYDIEYKQDLTKIC